MRFDEDDLRVLDEIQRNSKRTVKEIAKRLQLRPSTVYDKITRMEREAAILGYRAILSDATLGVPLTAFILISGRPSFNIDEAILRDSRIMEVWGVTGEYDALVKGRFGDVQEFSKFVLELREKYREHINRTETFVATVRIKETTVMPIRLKASNRVR